MLSRLEHGDVAPSLDTLAALAEALGTSCAALLRDPDHSLSDAQLVRKGEGLEVVRRGTRRGHTYHLLASDRGPRRAFEPFLVTLNSKSEIFPEFEHPGTEFIHLLEGSLRYRHGTETYLLKPGDSLTFRGDVPHGPDKLHQAAHPHALDHCLQRQRLRGGIVRKPWPGRRQAPFAREPTAGPPCRRRYRPCAARR